MEPVLVNTDSKEPEVKEPLHQDFYRPTMSASESLDVSDEQKELINRLMEIITSDSQFAKKGYDAVMYILTDGSVKDGSVKSDALDKTDVKKEKK